MNCIVAVAVLMESKNCLLITNSSNQFCFVWTFKSSNHSCFNGDLAHCKYIKSTYFDLCFNLFFFPCSSP